MANIDEFNKKRIKVAFSLLCLAFFALIARLGYIQVLENEWYRNKALSFQTRDIKIDAKRGSIYDRTGRELAISIEKRRVWADPSRMSIEDQNTNINKLSEIFSLDKNVLRDKFDKKQNGGIVSIKRWISDEEYEAFKEAVKAKEIKKKQFVWTSPDMQRIYPYEDFASYILGHVNADSKGAYGIELEYNEILEGLPGRTITVTDSSGKELPFSNGRYTNPVEGKGIVLTIDEVIQNYLENALLKSLEVNKAKRATGIVMDPSTGDILAMAALPDYDPNRPTTPINPYFQQVFDTNVDDKSKAWFDMWRNPLVNDAYEPGSTFKPITACAALEENLTSAKEQFDLKGYVDVSGVRIKDWDWRKGYKGLKNLKEAVENSYNAVFVELGQRLGVDKLYDYIDAFGLFSKTGIDLPGETTGLYYKRKDVGPVELATISFGQANSTTPIQLITAISAIANDGALMKPRLVKEYVNSNKEIVTKFEPEMVRQVISRNTARLMKDMLESEVSNGGGKNAYIEGYKVGGKTGTAQKVINGKYEDGKYVSSFVGIAPCNEPKLTILIVIDEPNPDNKNYYGSTLAAPIAREVLYDSLRYLDIKSDKISEDIYINNFSKNKVPNVVGMNFLEAKDTLKANNFNYKLGSDITANDESLVIDMFPKGNSLMPKESDIILYLKNEEKIYSDIILPDFTGKTIMETANILKGFNLRMKQEGNGVCYEQTPKAGTMVKEGDVIFFKFRYNN